MTFDSLLISVPPDEPTPGPGEFSPEYKLVEKRYPEYSMGEGVISRQSEYKYQKTGRGIVDCG